MAGTMEGFATVGGSDPKAATLWGSFTMKNEGGSWECKEFGMGSMENDTGWRDQVCEGRDGYVGLKAYIHSITNDQTETFGLLGWIEKAW
jgi:hypothetical protein